jgi:hypothetical protein
VKVMWADAADQEYVQGWEAEMFDQAEPPLEIRLCLEPEHSADGAHLISCKRPMFALKAARTTWQRISSREQLITYELSAEQYEMLLDKRLRYLELDDPLPNKLRQMRFSYECILTD